MRFSLLMVFLGVLQAAPSFACGVCIEDKVAATYDYQIVMDATARNHVVVYGQVEGNTDMGKLVRELAAVASRTAGVDRGTVRTSTTPAAFSFSLDPAMQTPHAAIRSVLQRLRTTGVQLSI